MLGINDWLFLPVPNPPTAWHGSSPLKNQKNGIWDRLLDSPHMSAKSRMIRKQYNQFSQNKKTWLDGGCRTLQRFYLENIWGLEVITSAGSRPWDKRGAGGGGVQKFFSALWASVWSKNERGAGPLGPFPGSGCTTHKWRSTYHTWLIMSWGIFSSPKCFCANNKENK